MTVRTYIPLICSFASHACKMSRKLMQIGESLKAVCHLLVLGIVLWSSL